MQPETISNAESELLNKTAESGEEVTDVIVDPDFKDDEENFVDKDGQAAMFPKEAKSASRREDLNQGFKSVEARLKKVKEHASFFKNFAAFISELDVDADRETIRENIKTALIKGANLQDDLHWAICQYKKIDGLEEQIAESDNAPRPEPKPHPTIEMDPESNEDDQGGLEAAIESKGEDE